MPNLNISIFFSARICTTTFSVNVLRVLLERLAGSEERLITAQTVLAATEANVFACLEVLCAIVRSDGQASSVKTRRNLTTSSPTNGESPGWR